MASVYRKKGRDGWYIHFKDGAGKWRELPSLTKDDTKSQAKAFAHDLEEKAKRQQRGLEPLPDSEPKMTFGELMDWWFEEYGKRLRSTTNKGFMEKHFREELGSLKLKDVTTDKLEGMLNRKASTLKPESLNHLRGDLHRIFSRAIRRKKWAGPNPVAAVPRFKVDKRLPEYLRWNEVEPVLAEIDEGVRPLFAIAVYLGLRKGEILGLRKGDVTLDPTEPTLAVQRSYGGTTTKGGHADLLPVPKELAPFLTYAVNRAKGELLFPHPDGRLYEIGEYSPEKILRRALARAGFVTHYRVKCRRCGTAFDSQEKGHGNCAKCGMKLWVSGVPRHVRFHDLRHTTATLLLKSGVPLAVVSRIMRHSSADITLDRYGHLDMDDMREGVNRLQFKPKAPSDS